MIYLGVPVMDGHELTDQLLLSLSDTCRSSDITVVIIDNNSAEPYREPTRDISVPVRVIRNEENLGYYRPLEQLAALATPADIVGLIHNDVLLYEEGWDIRVRDSFAHRADIGMIGFVGSNELDSAGGRGGGTMCRFRGERGQSQSAGRRVTGLEPAIILDSVVMLTRSNLVPLLRIDVNTPICHFLDKIWPLRLYEHGWKTAVLGVEMDHMGGMTAIANPRYFEAAERWCREHGLDDHGDPGLAIYLNSENLFLQEYRDFKRMIPSRMIGWDVVRVAA